MNLKISLFTIISLSCLLLCAQNKRITLKVTNYQDGRPLDTVKSYYNQANQLVRFDNSYGYTFNYYKDSLIEKSFIINKVTGLKNCIDTMESIYVYDKSNRLINQLYKNNSCPKEPRGSDGHSIFEDTLQKTLSLSDSIAYDYDKVGNLIKKTMFSNLNDTSDYIRTTYKYDDKKRKIEEKEDFNSGSRYLKIFKYTDSSVITYAFWYYIIVSGKPLHDVTEEVHNSKGKLSMTKYSTNNRYSEKLITLMMIPEG